MREGKGGSNGTRQHEPQRQHTRCVHVEREKCREREREKERENWKINTRHQNTSLLMPPVILYPTLSFQTTQSKSTAKGSCERAKEIETESALPTSGCWQSLQTFDRCLLELRCDARAGGRLDYHCGCVVRVAATFWIEHVQRLLPEPTAFHNA